MTRGGKRRGSIWLRWQRMAGRGRCSRNCCPSSPTLSSSLNLYIRGWSIAWLGSLRQPRAASGLPRHLQPHTSFFLLCLPSDSAPSNPAYCMRPRWHPHRRAATHHCSNQPPPPTPDNPQSLTWRLSPTPSIAQNPMGEGSRNRSLTWPITWKTFRLHYALLVLFLFGLEKKVLLNYHLHFFHILLVASPLGS
jgi:hypothetical protein